MITVRDLMSTDVVTVSPDLELRDAIELLAGRHVSGAPVVSGRRLVGVVSMTDLLDFAATTEPAAAEDSEGRELEEEEMPGEWREGEGAEAMGGAEGALNPGEFYLDFFSSVGADVLERFQRTRAPGWDVFAGHTVSEVMTPQRLLTVSAETPLREAARRMLESGVHRLIVTDDTDLAGIISTTDIVRGVAKGMLPTEEGATAHQPGGANQPVDIPAERRR